MFFALAALLSVRLRRWALLVFLRARRFLVVLLWRWPFLELILDY